MTEDKEALNKSIREQLHPDNIYGSSTKSKEPDVNFEGADFKYGFWVGMLVMAIGFIFVNSWYYGDMPVGYLIGYIIFILIAHYTRIK
jgi:hypothetical protein